MGLTDCHIKYIGDVLSLVCYRKRLLVVSLSIADIAFDIDIRKEVHLYLQLSVTRAVLASAARDIE